MPLIRHRLKPKFHYTDFATFTKTSPRKKLRTQIMKVCDTGYVADFHDMCLRLSLVEVSVKVGVMEFGLWASINTRQVSLNFEDRNISRQRVVKHSKSGLSFKSRKQAAHVNNNIMRFLCRIWWRSINAQSMVVRMAMLMTKLAIRLMLQTYVACLHFLSALSLALLIAKWHCHSVVSRC